MIDFYQSPKSVNFNLRENWFSSPPDSKMPANFEESSLGIFPCMVIWWIVLHSPQNHFWWKWVKVKCESDPLEDYKDCKASLDVGQNKSLGESKN